MDNQYREYCKLSIAGFSLTILSVIIGQFFIFNDAMIRDLGRDVFDALWFPLLICLFLTHIAGFALSVAGLIHAIRKKYKGKVFSIVGICIYLVEAAVIFLCFGLLLMVATGERRSPEPQWTAITTETTVRETKEPEFYENNELLIYLRENINEDMTLAEIIDVYESMARTPAGNKDNVIFEAGAKSFLVYDSYKGEYVEAGYHYGFCLKRWIKAEDGEVYKICVNVMYKPDDDDYYKKDEAMRIDLHNKVDKEFYDYVRNSEAFKYASSKQIERIDIYMGPRE